MIRPFISSLGKATTETVFSLVTSWAYLERAKPNNSLAFSSHSSFASSSFCLMKAAISLETLDSTLAKSSSLASWVDIWATFSSSTIIESIFSCKVASLRSNSLSLRDKVSFFSSNEFSLASNAASRRSMLCSLCCNDFSCCCNSCFLSWISRLASCFISLTACLPSSCAFLVMCSALISASRINFLALFLAMLFLTNGINSIKPTPSKRQTTPITIPNQIGIM